MEVEGSYIGFLDIGVVSTQSVRIISVQNKLYVKVFFGVRLIPTIMSLSRPFNFRSS